MTPVIPKQRGVDLPTTAYAANQPQYNPLPSWRLEDGTVITRWRLTWRERIGVLFGGHLWLTVLTFHRKLQPVKITVECPVVDER
jgi:hypothetical protein